MRASIKGKYVIPESAKFKYDTPLSYSLIHLNNPTKYEPILLSDLINNIFKKTGTTNGSEKSNKMSTQNIDV